MGGTEPSVRHSGSPPHTSRSPPSTSVEPWGDAPPPQLSAPPMLPPPTPPPHSWLCTQLTAVFPPLPPPRCCFSLRRSLLPLHAAAVLCPPRTPPLRPWVTALHSMGMGGGLGALCIIPTRLQGPVGRCCRTPGCCCVPRPPSATAGAGMWGRPTGTDLLTAFFLSPLLSS